MDYFKVVTLISGIEVGIIHATGVDYSRASYQYILYNMDKPVEEKLDPSMFFMVEFCRVDGEKKDIHYYMNLMVDDYIKIMEVIGEFLTVLNK